MIVLDSSVILKWIFDEEEAHEKAIKYRQMHMTGEEIVVVPSLFFYEIGNVLSTKARLSDSEAADFFTTFYDFDFEIYNPGIEDFLSGIALSKRYRISLYDAVYVGLAGRLKCSFVTSDKRLFDRVKELKEVRLL